MKTYIKIILISTITSSIVYAQSIQMSVEGALKIQSPQIGSEPSVSGVLQWSNEDFEVWNGKGWVSLTHGLSICVDGYQIHDPFRSFGREVAIDDQIAMVGAPNQYSEEGKIFIFNKVGPNWLISDTLCAPDGYIGNGFGGAISIYQDIVVIGASEDINFTGLLN